MALAELKYQTTFTRNKIGQSTVEVLFHMIRKLTKHW